MGERMEGETAVVAGEEEGGAGGREAVGYLHPVCNLPGRCHRAESNNEGHFPIRGN